MVDVDAKSPINKTTNYLLVIELEITKQKLGRWARLILPS